MHDVTVSLHGHKFGHFHGAVLGDSPDVVPSQIHQHQMLGSFLRVSKQLHAQPFVLGLSRASLPRSSNWADLDPSVPESDVHFRRAADQGKSLAEAEAKHVGRWIDESQRAI